MFKKKYKLAMENIKPSQDRIAEIKQMAEDRKLPPERNRKLLRKRIFNKKLLYRMGALAACAALLFSVYKTVPHYFSSGKPASSSPKEASSYAELYKILQNIRAGKEKQNYDEAEENLGGIPMPETPPAEPGSEIGGESRTETDEYSGTNLQVLGVDEADIVKTDGKYIYAVAKKYIYIVSATDGRLELVSKVPRYVFDGEALISKAFEIYIRKDRLIVLKDFLAEPAATEKRGSAQSGAALPGVDPVLPRQDGGFDVEYEYYAYYINGKTAVGVEIYDISDIENPKALNTIGQSGYIVSSRMVGDILYLVTNYSVTTPDIKKSRPETYIPMTYKNGNDELIAARDILYNPGAKSDFYVVVSGIDTSGNGEMVSVKTVLGYGCTVYSTAKNLYLTSSDAYSEQTEDGYVVGYNLTRIFRFSLDGGNVDFAAEGSVPGHVLNQFAMDEHNGVFRIVTTVDKYKYAYRTNGAEIYPVERADNSSWETSVSNTGTLEPDIKPLPSGDNTSNTDADNGNSNALYTLNADLEITGKIENLAPGERVYSVRFMGDTAYFVTFRQVDPLFTVDLSDPAKPRVLGELKIPGFSEYLHPYGEGLLFGLGKNADAQTGISDCMKLTMFDISNPAGVSEKHTLLLKDFYYSHASYNHKAILIDHEKNIIAFQADAYYLVYSYSAENGFKKLAQIPIFDSKTGYMGDDVSNARGLYIEDYMYIVTQRFVSSYDLEDFKMEHKIEFRE